MSEFEEAIAEFQILVRDFPTNTKVPSALNNQGYSYSRLGQNANAIALFQQVISEYPNDAAVVIARQNLQQLEGKN
jgi:TolA-binding protein